MAFIHKIVGPDEKLVGIARLHWIYAAKGIAWLLGLMASGIIIRAQLANILDGGLMPIGNAVFWIGTLVGAIFFLFYTIKMLSTELGLTTKRCIYKRGWIFVDVREVDLEEIKSSSVDNGILGRILNYGYIYMDARFIEDVGLPAISDPYRYTKAMNTVRSKLKDDTMRVILDDGEAHAFSAKRKERDDVHELEHDEYEYESVSSNPRENIKEITQSKSKAKPKSKKKRSDYIKSDDEETLPLKSDQKKELKEEIIEDFEEVEGEPIKK